jgi:hypothetical protein
MGSHSHPGRPWGPWQQYVNEFLTDWERTYYRVVHHERPASSSGQYWAIVRANVDFTQPGQEREFDDWYTSKHMPEICSHPGIYQGWRLLVEPDDNDLGPRRQWSWGVYQIDDPLSFAAAREDRAARGIEPWDGIWLSHVRDFEITFHEVIYHIEKPAAVAVVASRS